jgi:methionyl-tRNA formyltransferase
MRIAYAGTPEFAVPALDALASSNYGLECVITQPDRKAGRGRKIVETPIKKRSTPLNVQIYQPEDINHPASIAKLESMNLDLLIVAAYGQIFTQKLLDTPGLGCINIHASLLPRWRGAAPIQNAILGGDDETGISIMQMCKAMDAGDIWLQKSTNINNDDTAQTLHDRLADMGGKAILEALSIIEKGQLKPEKQAQNLVTYCSKLHKKDGLINWQESSNKIHRKIRAFYPWPGSYTTLAGRRILIIEASMADLSAADHSPGTIFHQSKEGMFVATGSGTLRIETLTPEGGKKVSANDFSNANQVLNCVLGQ